MSGISDISSSSAGINSNLWLVNYLSDASSADSSSSLLSSESSSSSSDSLTVSGNLSTLSSFISASESLSDENKAELKKILKEAQSGMGKKGYDAEDLADSASDGLKAELKDQNIDLKDVLNSYESLYSSSKSASSASDYTSLLTAGGDSKLYSSITTLLNRQFEID